MLKRNLSKKIRSIRIISLSWGLRFEKPPINLEAMQKVWLRGGYPEPITSTNSAFYTHWMQHYYDTYINRDIAGLFPKLNRVSYRRFLEMLASLWDYLEQS